MSGELKRILRMKKTGTFMVRTGKVVQKAGWKEMEWRHVEKRSDAEALLGVGVQLKLM